MNYERLHGLVFAAHRWLPYRFGDGAAFPPLHVLIELTYRCNLRCDFCQFYALEQPAAGGSARREIGIEEVEAILAELPRFTLVTFTGGEPFLRPDALEILRRAARRRAVTFISNGTLIDEACARALVGLAPRGALRARGLVLAEISLQAEGEAHDRIVGRSGSFEKSVETLARLARLRAEAGKRLPVIGVKTVITERSVEGLAALYRRASEMGVDSFNLMICSGIQAHEKRMRGSRAEMPDQAPQTGEKVDVALLRRQIAEIERLRRERGGPPVRLTPAGMPWGEVFQYYDGGIDHRDYHCVAPWSTVAVSAWGEVVACPYFGHGNMREERLRSIWNGPEMRELRRSIRDRRSFPGCVGCCHLRHGAT